LSHSRVFNFLQVSSFNGLLGKIPINIKINMLHIKMEGERNISKQIKANKNKKEKKVGCYNSWVFTGYKLLDCGYTE